MCASPFARKKPVWHWARPRLALPHLTNGAGTFSSSSSSSSHHFHGKVLLLQQQLHNSSSKSQSRWGPVGVQRFLGEEAFLFPPLQLPLPSPSPSVAYCVSAPPLPQAAVGGDSFLSSSAPLAFASPFPAQLVHSEEPKKEKKKKRNPRFQRGGGQGEVQHQDLLGRDPLRRY